MMLWLLIENCEFSVCLNTVIKHQFLLVGRECFFKWQYRSEIGHINSCEHSDCLTNMMKFNTDEQGPDGRFHLCYFVSSNCVIIDKASLWSVLLFKEALAIHRQKPLLNHGAKVSRELAVFC